MRRCHLENGHRWLIFILCVSLANTSTHWVVTEDGKLHAQTESVYSMRRPHDLAAFIHQEQRVNAIEELKIDILAHQDIVDTADDKEDGFEEKFLKSEESCIKAGKRMPEFDFYISTVLPLENKGIRAEDHINLRHVSPAREFAPPYCDSPLDFSMNAFEHLKGVQDRKSMQGTHELGLKSAITHRDSEDEYGDLVREALKKNDTSWILYNMAAFYWRIKGNPYEAIECLRRALHYSPRHFRDVAYISLGNILHRGRYSQEAAIVVMAALDVTKDLNVNHFTLGNIFAVLSDYNKSIEYFDSTLALQPDFEAAEKRRYSVICHSKLERALEEQQRSLQHALDELKMYQRKHETMQSLTEKMISEQAPQHEKIRSRIELEILQHTRKIKNIDVMGEYCEMRSRNGEPHMECSWKQGGSVVSDMDDANEMKFSSTPLPDGKKLKETKPPQKPLSSTTKAQPQQDYSKPLRPPLYGKENKPTSTGTTEHTQEGWPSKAECEKHNSKPLDWNEYPSTYLPPENKGFDSRVFLGDAIDIPFKEQHPLPWYPPVCVNIVDLRQGEMFLDHLSAIKDRDKIPLKLTDPSMRKILLKLVNDGEVEEEEVGQRILTALKQNLAPRWLLYNLAGIYWRVVGNNYHAIECLRRSLHFVPADYVDVPLVNMANILYKWNRLDDALNLTKQALIFCPFEPITHFTHANLLAAKKNVSGAVYHYTQALELDPDFSQALTLMRNLLCTSKYHKPAQSISSKNTCKPVKQEVELTDEQKSCQPITICTNGDTKIPPMAFDATNPVTSLGAFVRKNKMIDPLEVQAMKDFHRVHGLCVGSECEQIVHNPGTEPFIKIKSLGDGHWAHRMLFATPDEMPQSEPNVCFLLKGGVRSPGCDHSEFSSSEERVRQLEKMLAELIDFIDQQEAAGEVLVDHEEAFQSWANDKESGKAIELNGFLDIVCVSADDDSIRCFSKKDASPEETELPEVTPRLKGPGFQIRKLKPADSECQGYKSVDFSLFTSTWLSVAPKGIEYVNNQVTLADVKEFLDFDEVIGMEIQEPICQANFGASVSLFDHLPSIANREKLSYGGEQVLKDVIQVLGEDEEPVAKIGTRISRALNKNSTSWVLGCLGALYWRLQGDAPKALDCLRMALSYVPRENKHIPLLSMANILHRAGALNDAIEIASRALEVSPDTVVIHFSVGNMYAAKADFRKAAEYYESTLALQETFEPAKVRLLAIICGGLLEKNDEEGEEESNVEDED